MKFFRSLSLKKKLIVITMLISIVSLLLACIAFIVIDTITFRRDMVREQTLLAKVIGNTSAAVIEFQDVSGAEEILSSLSEKDQIISAVLYEAEGKVVGKYHRKGWDFLAPKLKEDGYYFSDNHLGIFNSVRIKGNKVGAVYLKSDLEEIGSRQKQYAVIIIIILFVVSTISFILSSKLQVFISKPILDLAELTKRVSKEKDYSLRAEKTSDDEVGLLMSGFNDMLRQIQRRDMASIDYQKDLEGRVKLRTADLEEEVRVRKEAEEKLWAFSEQLQKSNRELENFTHVSSHDLQEPLRKIIVFGDHMQKICGDSLEDQAEEYLVRMIRAAKRMQTLINDLLAFSKLKDKTESFDRVDLNKVVREVISDLELKIEESRGFVDVGTLPTIDAEPTSMHQLLQNLISNGLKFCKQDEFPVLKIDSTVEKPDGNDPSHRELIKLAVEDNGIGFDEKYTDRIFSVFQRLHTQSEYDGNGIGLAICRKIAEQHGGSITAKSRPGCGAVFTVMLPVNQTYKEEHDGKQQSFNHNSYGR